MAKYWQHLSANGITRDRLCSYERKITEEPYYLPHTIGDFENYLGILKQLHSSGDLNMLVQEARHHVQGDVHHAMNEMLHNFNDHDTLRQMERVLVLRQKLANHLG